MEPAVTCPRAGDERPPLSLAQVLRAALGPVGRPHLPPHHWKVLNALLACRTPQSGGHRYRCEHCGREHFVPRSCGNRHCPQCQWQQALAWLEQQEAVLLPVPYFHLVFTLPHELNPILQQNQRALYQLLFQAVSQTLLEFGRNNLGGQLGLTLVLHTWSQTLLDHYHLHGIVTGGGRALNGSGWKSTGDRFLFPVMALARVFRGKFCAGLRRLHAQGQLQFHGQISPLADTAAFQAQMRRATARSWNVYAKRPFAGPPEVLRYLSRYTHRVAITPRRLRKLDPAAGTVEFAHKIRRDPAPPLWTTMELAIPEFLRRFCLHILPPRFVKIRHYGLLANRGRRERIAQVKALLQAEGIVALASCQPAPDTGKAAGGGLATPRVCPYCGQRALVWIETLTAAARAPPPS